MASKTITLTYGDVCENHYGMEQIGTLRKHGLSPKFLSELYAKYSEHSRLYHLQHDEAMLLVIRNGVNLLLDNRYEQLYAEQNGLEPDTKAFMRGRVVNKQARYNLCFSEEGHEADFANRQGTVVPFSRVPLTSQLREVLQRLFEIENLQCEGNYYYDTSKPNVGIGFHGDTERRVVIGVRLGSDMPIEFRLFKRFATVGEPIRVTLHGGDIYAMSEKATGFDWKKSSILTLRHAAGSDAFLDRERKRIEQKEAVKQKPKTEDESEIIVEE